MRGANDIVNAMDMVAECKEELLDVRRTAEEYSDAVYAHAVRLANEVGAEPSAPRVAKRQRHRQSECRVRFASAVLPAQCSGVA